MNNRLHTFFFRNAWIRVQNATTGPARIIAMWNMWLELISPS